MSTKKKPSLGGLKLDSLHLIKECALRAKVMVEELNLYMTGIYQGVDQLPHRSSHCPEDWFTGLQFSRNALVMCRPDTIINCATSPSYARCVDCTVSRHGPRMISHTVLTLHRPPCNRTYHLTLRTMLCI